MPPVRARRPVVDKPEEDPGGRRGCMAIGAVLGIVVGALIAFLALPPLFSHYFGAADIELGKDYEADGKVVRVLAAERAPGPDGQPYPGVFVVRLRVTANKTWAPNTSDFELELTTGGNRLSLLASEPFLGGQPFPLAEAFELRLTFPGTERRDTGPAKLHLATPNVRFHLQPGKPR